MVTSTGRRQDSQVDIMTMSLHNCVDKYICNIHVMEPLAQRLLVVNTTPGPYGATVAMIASDQQTPHPVQDCTARLASRLHNAAGLITHLGGALPRGTAGMPKQQGLVCNSST